MQIPRAVVAFNKAVNNPLQGTYAWALPPWAVVLHRGRRSGKTYRTPVIAYTGHGIAAVPVFYGEGSDWVRNLMAARGGALTRRARTLRLSNPRLVTRADAVTLPPGARALTRLVPSVLVADLGGVLGRGRPTGLEL
jgi:deazaflavin-dependent oxidoreductase (nitroreductase family)